MRFFRSALAPKRANALLPFTGYNPHAMRVRINGAERELPENTTLLQLLQERGIDPRIVVVEYNYEIIPRERYPEIQLKEGDNLEIVQMVAGG